MLHKAERIIEGILISSALIIGLMVLSMVALCLTTCFSHYVRRFVFAMNDEAVAEEEEVVEGAGARRQGLDKAAIDRLPIVEFGMKGGGAAAPAEKEEGRGGGGRDCGVCLADFDEKERVRLLPWCHHCFHPDCIDAWLSSHGTCPLCRRPPPLPDAVVVDLPAGSPPFGRL